MTQAPILTHLAAAVNQLTPLSLAERSWDNVGLMVEAPLPRVVSGRARVLCCIDLTTAVANEALSSPSTSCILTYHPPIFSGLKSLTLSSPLQTSLLRCIAQGVSVFCIHTAADNALQGVNDFMADGLLQGLEGGSVKAIVEKLDVPEGQGGAGSGRIVDLGVARERSEVVESVKAKLGLEHLQAAWAAGGAEQIRTVAICAGSGSGVLKDVQADLYLTGELGHHEILAASAKGIHVLLCNHSATERPWLSEFAPRLEMAMNAAAGAESYEVAVSTEDREPLQVV